MKQAEAILRGPGRVECRALRANISEAQCARNQAQARMQPEGPLYPCLTCRQADRAVRQVKPRAPKTSFGLVVPTKGWREAKVSGKLEPSTPHRAGSIVKRMRELRDMSARAGWTTRRIDTMLKKMNGQSTPAVKRAVLAEWEGMLVSSQQSADSSS